MVISFVFWTMKRGGAERVIATLANDFAKRPNTRVNILVVNNYKSEYELDNRIHFIQLGNVIKENKGILLKSYALLKIFKKTIHNTNTNIVVAFDPKLAGMCKIAMTGKKVTVIGAERTNPYQARLGIQSKFFTWFSKHLDGFIFQTRGASQFYPMKTRKMGIVIPNGISIDIPKDLPETSERKSAICTTGRLVKVKRYDLLIQAFKRVSEKYPEYTLDIYGDGPSKDEIKDMIFDCKLQDKVFLRGVVDDVAEVLCQHKVFVLSSDYEGMPNGLIEAMACGCACVSTNCDFGPNELIRDGIDGLLALTGDIIELSDAIIRLISDEKLIQQFSSEAIKVSERRNSKYINDRYYEYISSTYRKE